MVRVACTHPVNPPGATLGGGVLCSQVALDPFLFCRIQMRVDICMSLICIGHVVRKPQLGQIDTNRHLLHGNRRHDQLTCIVVNQ
jgi:hypothetical protein